MIAGFSSRVNGRWCSNLYRVPLAVATRKNYSAAPQQSRTIGLFTARPVCWLDCIFPFGGLFLEGLRSTRSERVPLWANPTGPSKGRTRHALQSMSPYFSMCNKTGRRECSLPTGWLVFRWCWLTSLSVTPPPRVWTFFVVRTR